MAERRALLCQLTEQFRLAEQCSVLRRHGPITQARRRSSVGGWFDARRWSMEGAKTRLQVCSCARTRKPAMNVRRASLYAACSLQGAYRGFTGGKAPAREGVATLKPPSSHPQSIFSGLLQAGRLSWQGELAADCESGIAGGGAETQHVL